MLRFEHTEYFFLLLLLPLVTGIYFYVQWKTKKQLQQIGSINLIRRLMPERSDKKALLKLVLLNVLILFLVLSLAQPQMGTKMEKVQRKGIDVMIALDVSKSMLSQDIAPSRLEKSKLLIQTLLHKLDGDRVGLVIFAGNAYLQMPLTVDYSSLMLYLRSITTNSVPTQGTIITEALRQSESAFKATEKKYKAVIVITDGEDHEENAIDMAEELASDGTKVFTVGVGTQNGGTIPVYDNNGRIVDNKKDENGQVIISRMNANMLQALAKGGNGNYYVLDNTKIVGDLLAKDIAKMETKTINDKIFTDYVEQFQYFLVFALVVLLADLLVTYRNRWLDFKK